MASKQAASIPPQVSNRSRQSLDEQNDAYSSVEQLLVQKKLNKQPSLISLQDQSKNNNNYASREQVKAAKRRSNKDTLSHNRSREAVNRSGGSDHDEYSDELQTISNQLLAP